MVLVALVAILRVATASGGWAQAPDASPKGDGQRVYNDFCVTCHMPEGERTAGHGQKLPMRPAPAPRTIPDIPLLTLSAMDPRPVFASC